MKISNIIIRPETLVDDTAIDDVTRQAFATHPHSRQTEHFIVRALRRADALTISLVAEHAGRVVGHIAFSPVTISDGAVGWYILGPVSVLPALQKQGIGRQLIESGLAGLRGLGAAGCVLVGEPAFYQRFGFANPATLTLSGVPPEYFLARTLGPDFARGEVTHHPAFFAES